MPCEKELELAKAEVKRLKKLLNELTPPLETLLRHRGFRVFRKEPPDDLLLPAPPFIDDYYEKMKKYSFRLFLRDVIKHQEFFREKDVTRYATAGVTREYMDYLACCGLMENFGNGHRLVKRPVKSFGATLEWFTAEVLKREFSSEAIWGIKFKGHKEGGDYDLIAKVDGARILYMEVKSSPPKQIYQNEIKAFLGRTGELAPDLAVFFMDTELRMKDKIVPMFELELPGRPVERLYKEIFRIEGKVFIINAKDSVPGNLERVLSFYLRRKS